MSTRTRSSRTAAHRSRPIRTTHPIHNHISYRELSTDGSDTESADEPYIDAPRHKRRRVSSFHSSEQQSTSQPSRKRKANTVRHFASTLGAKKVEAGIGGSILKNGDGILRLGGRVPHWQSLPYHILLQIFRHASHPLWTDRFEPTPTITWLLNTALLCKTFAEPALSALYWSPPLCPPTRAHRLTSHLASQAESSTFNYRAKVKFLEMEALSTLARKYGGHDPINLADIIIHTPQLRGVGIHLLTDDPLLHKANLGSGSINKAVYQSSMIPALERSKVSLLEWKWNSSIAGKQFSVWKLKDIHSAPPFRSLEELTLVSYQSGKAKRSTADELSGPNQVPAEGNRTSEEQLADALNCLPNLKRLRFKMSPIVNKKLLCLLPQNLEMLEVMDCSSLTSDMLNKFLKSHGQNIRELVLNHNQALNLSFLVDFAITCPKAETLKMNLTYYNSHFCFQNSDPRFPALLLQSEIPKWPASLRSLELHHLRKWDIETAELFFSSLVDSAATLPSLRHLNIKASLDESGWRERVAFRDRWVSRLERVFLRRSPPPNLHLVSLGAFKAYKAPAKKNGGVLKSPNDLAQSSYRHQDSSRFSHVEVLEAMADAKIESESESDSDIPLALTRRATLQSTRLRKSMSETSTKTRFPPPSKGISRGRRRRRRRNSDSDSSSQDSALDDDSLELDTQRSFQTDEKKLYVQGMCNVVYVLVDNLRPMEEQLNESNFLDEEMSGDEDWVGDDNMLEKGGYAW